MINYSECKLVLDDTRMYDRHLDILKHNGFDVDKIIKIEYSKNDVESDVYFIESRNKIEHVGIYDNKIEFCY